MGQRKSGGSREKKNTYHSVVCVYAPTAKAPPGVAQKFTEDLQDTVDKIPTSDVLLLLGDVNARVGCSVADGDVWRGVRGRHGVGCCNEVREKFCAVNQFTVMSTWIMKKSIHQVMVRNGTIWHKTEMYGQPYAKRGLHHQWISIDTGPTQLISQDSTELATIPVLVDGHSVAKETVPGTATFVAVPL